MFIVLAQLVILSTDTHSLCSSVMEETGGLGVDVLIDNQG